jgi:protein involved in sex pheromone biosynthesis
MQKGFDFCTAAYWLLLRACQPIISSKQQEAIKRRNAQKETPGEIARSYNVSRWTIARL